MPHRIGRASASIFLAILLARPGVCQDAPASRPDLVERLASRLAAVEREAAERAAHEHQLEGRIGELERRIVDAETTSESRAAALASRDAEASRLIEDAAERLARIEARPALGSGVSLGGYIDLEFRSDQAVPHSTFAQHRLVLRLESSLSECVSFQSEIEIEGGGAGSDFLTDDELSVEYGEIHFHFGRPLNLKAGALIVPFGRLNILHDAPLLQLTDRPLMHDDLVPTTWTEAGVGAYGAFDAGTVTFDYDVIVCNGFNQRFDPVPGGGFEPVRASFREDNNQNKMIIGRFGASPDLDWLDALTAGFSFGFGKYDDFDRQSIRLFGLDAAVKKGPFELKGEWARFVLDRGPAEIAAGAPPASNGWYVEGDWHFFPKCWRGRSCFLDAESLFTLAVRYDRIDTDESARGIDRATRGDAFLDDRQRITFGVNFRPLQRTVIKVEYQWLPELPGIAAAKNDRFVVSFATYF